jgi:hypothetical protein
VQQVTQKNRSNLLPGWPDSSGPNSAPRRFTPPPPRSTPHPEGISSTSFSGLAAHLMVNVPQSEAPSPRNIRPGNDE